jgi:hypothetical protein
MLSAAIITVSLIAGYILMLITSACIVGGIAGAYVLKMKQIRVG